MEISTFEIDHQTHIPRHISFQHEVFKLRTDDGNIPEHIFVPLKRTNTYTTGLETSNMSFPNVKFKSKTRVACIDTTSKHYLNAKQAHLLSHSNTETKVEGLP